MALKTEMSEVAGRFRLIVYERFNPTPWVLVCTNGKLTVEPAFSGAESATKELVPTSSVGLVAAKSANFLIPLTQAKIKLTTFESWLCPVSSISNPLSFRRSADACIHSECKVV